MLFDLNKLHGAREHLERTLPASVFEPPDDDYRVVAPVTVSMDVEKASSAGSAQAAGNVFRVVGRASTRLELDCGRCVEPFEMPVEVSFDLRYVPAEHNAGEGEREIDEDDLTTAFYREGMLDVTDLLREQFQLALPMKPLCSTACRGLCLECGANLNRTACGHEAKWEDPRLAPLKGLLDRHKEN